MNGIGGRQLVRRRLRGRDEPGDRLGGGPQDQQSAVRLGQLVKPVLEARGDAEVAAAAADRPEQVGMVLAVDRHALAIRGHDLGREQVVDGQPELADEVADPATERDPADPDGSRVAEPDDKPVLTDRLGHLRRGEAGLGPCRPSLDIDLEALHVREVEDDPALRHAVTGIAVPTASNRELEPGLAGEPHDVLDIVGIGHLDDHRRSAVDRARDDGPGAVVVVVAGRDHAPLQVGPQSRDREVCRSLSRVCRRHRIASPTW
jgi:hypothetical protein